MNKYSCTRRKNFGITKFRIFVWQFASLGASRVKNTVRACHSSIIWPCHGGQLLRPYGMAAAAVHTPHHAPHSHTAHWSLHPAHAAWC